MKREMEKELISLPCKSIYFDSVLYRQPLSTQHIVQNFPPLSAFTLFWFSKRKLEDDEYNYIFSKGLEIIAKKERYPKFDFTPDFKAVLKSINKKPIKCFPEVFLKYLIYKLNKHDLNRNGIFALVSQIEGRYIARCDELGHFLVDWDYYNPQFCDDYICVTEFKGPRYMELIEKIIEKEGDKAACMCCCHDDFYNCPLDIGFLDMAESQAFETRLKLIKMKYF